MLDAIHSTVLAKLIPFSLECFNRPKRIVVLAESEMEIVSKQHSEIAKNDNGLN